MRYLMPIAFFLTAILDFVTALLLLNNQATTFMTAGYISMIALSFECYAFGFIWLYWRKKQ